jgi:hypothetical protein
MKVVCRAKLEEKAKFKGKQTLRLNQKPSSRDVSIPNIKEKLAGDQV